MAQNVVSMLAAAVLLAAPSGPAQASGTGNHSHPQGAGEPGDRSKVTRTVEVLMNDRMRFEPASVTVKRGEVVRFVVKNVGEQPHEFILGTQKEIKDHHAIMKKHPEMEHDDPNAVSVAPGKTGEIVWKFTVAGAFQFACLKPGHLEAGMVGNLAVRR